jgi:hypothetical protein
MTTLLIAALVAWSLVFWSAGAMGAAIGLLLLAELSRDMREALP